MGSSNFARSRRLGMAPWLLVAGLSGCSTTQARPEWVRTLTWWEAREADPRFKGPMPAERIELLREQAKAAISMPPEDQQRLATEWADAYANEADPMIRRELVRAIAGCGSPRAAEVLQAGLSDSSRDVRTAACDGWATHGGPMAVPRLGEVVRKENSSDVRLAALRALGRLKGPEVVQAIAPALEDRDPAMQYRAVQSLREVTGKDFGDDANAWREFAKGGTPAEISVVDRMKLDLF